MANILDGLVAGWEMNEPSGNTIYNVLGSSLSGTGVNTPTPNQVGKLNKSWIFVNSSVEYFVINDPNSVITSTFTICSWIKYQSVTSTWDPYILCKYNGDGVNKRSWWLGIDNNGYPACGLSSDGTSAQGHYCVSATNYNSTLVGGWCWLVGMYDGTYIRIFLNNIEIANLNIGAHTVYASNQNIWLGVGWGTYNYTSFKGNIDQTLLYNRNLTTDELTQLYNSGSGLTYSDWSTTTTTTTTVPVTTTTTTVPVTTTTTTTVPVTTTTTTTVPVTTTTTTTVPVTTTTTTTIPVTTTTTTTIPVTTTTTTLPVPVIIGWTLDSLKILFISGITDCYDGEIPLSSITFNLYKHGSDLPLESISENGIYDIFISVTNTIGNTITNYISNITVNDSYPIIIYKPYVIDSNLSWNTDRFSGITSGITGGIEITSGFTFNISGFDGLLITRLDIIDNIVNYVYDYVDLSLNKYMLDILIVGTETYETVDQDGGYCVKMSITNSSGHKTVEYFIMNVISDIYQSCYSQGFWQDNKVWIDFKLWLDHPI
jgi:hypothetical protein